MLNTRNVRLIVASAFATLTLAFSIVAPVACFADTASTETAAAESTATDGAATDATTESTKKTSTKVRNRLSEEQQKSLVRNLKTNKGDNGLLPSFLDKHELTDRNRDNKMF